MCRLAFVPQTCRPLHRPELLRAGVACADRPRHPRLTSAARHALCQPAARARVARPTLARAAGCGCSCVSACHGEHSTRSSTDLAHGRVASRHPGRPRASKGRPRHAHPRKPGQKVEYAAVYPGIDLVYYGCQRQLEYDFVVSPGTDPNAIRMNISGAERLELDAAGDLVLHAGGQELRQHKPFVYQEVNGRRQEVVSRFVLHEMASGVASGPRGYEPGGGRRCGGVGFSPAARVGIG